MNTFLGRKSIRCGKGYISALIKKEVRKESLKNLTDSTLF